MLRWEPRVQPEGQLGLEAAEELTQLDTWLQKNLPAALSGSEGDGAATDCGTVTERQEESRGAAGEDGSNVEPKCGNTDDGKSDGCEFLSGEKEDRSGPPETKDGTDSSVEVNLCCSSVHELSNSATIRHDASKDSASIV